MSAECHICGYDLPYMSDCQYCSLRAELAEARELLDRSLPHLADRKFYDRVRSYLSTHPKEEG